MQIFSFKENWPYGNSHPHEEINAENGKHVTKYKIFVHVLKFL